MILCNGFTVRFKSGPYAGKLVNTHGLPVKEGRPLFYTNLDDIRDYVGRCLVGKVDDYEFVPVEIREITLTA